MQLTDKKIPKYIVKLIQREDKKTKHFYAPGKCRFYAYLTKYHKDLIKVTVAVKEHKGKWYCKQVAWHGMKKETCLLKDIEYCYMGMNYRVGWYDEGIQKEKRWYENGVKWAYQKYYDPWAPVVNLSYLKKFPEYQYSAWQHFEGTDILGYLRLYEQFPQIELLMKLGFKKIATSKAILKRVGKDKKFCKWLLNHKEQILGSYHYIDSILQAYRTGQDLESVQRLNEAKKQLKRYTDIHKIFKNDRLEKLLKYLAEQKIKIDVYNDYLKACIFLGLDMTLPKNAFPHDFHRWHDIRIDEYHTAQIVKDEEERKEFYREFAEIAKKYLPLEYAKKGDFVCLIAQSPRELMKEGDALHHCVGKMNYDQRFVREESLIFFVRPRDQPQEPFVTLEYSLKERKVLQCYGEHDHNPSEEVLDYVNRIWLPYANRKMKKITA